MLRQNEDRRKWLLEVTERFRQKGAVSPDRAMTAEELGLPPTFEVAMKRRLGRSGIFVKVNGKYYLSEQRLKQMEDLSSAGWSAGSSRKRLLTLRILQLGGGILVVTLFLLNLFVDSYEIRLISIFLIIVWLAISFIRICYMVRLRKTMHRFL